MIPKEVFNLDKCIDVDEKFWEVEPLKTLDFSFNKIASIPEDIANLVDCTTMKFKDNAIMELPDALFGSCTNLRHLDMGKNKISKLNDSIGYSTNLRELIVSENQLVSIPDSLKHCSSLRILELQQNLLRILPSSFWCIDGITNINISSNKLSSLPSSLSDLRSLEVFNCSCNNLTELPSLRNLVSLKYLDSTQNSLSRFPELPVPSSSGKGLTHVYLGYNRLTVFGIADLLPHRQTLSELLLHNNQLRELPPEMEGLFVLKVLDVSNNELRDLPASLGWLESLQHLRADGNQIKTIRQLLLTRPAPELKAFLRTRGPSLGLGLPPTSTSIGGINGKVSKSSSSFSSSSSGASPIDSQLLFRIRDMGSTAGLLDLSKLSLDNLPSSQLVESVMSMPSSATLTSVDLSGNRFTHLPLDIFSSLPMVKAINLSENKLGDGQGWVSVDGQPLHSALTVLDLTTNKISGFLLGELISNGNLAGLRELAVSSNPLKNIDPILNQLTLLRVLRLAYCGLTAIHPLDISLLPHMTTLDLSNNKLQTLHDRESDSPTNPFFRAVTLEFLSLENNGLREIPLELALLPKLTTLLVGGNPQRLIRPQVIQQGSAKVLETMRNKLGVVDGGML